MKQLFIFWLMISMLSCGVSTDSSNTVNDDTTGALKSNSVQGSESSNRIEDDSSPDELVITKHIRKAWEKEKLSRGMDNVKALVSQGLFSEDPTLEQMNFLIFTKSMNTNQGYYPKVMQLASVKYLTEKTERFAYHFRTSAKLDEEDLDNWAKCVSNSIRSKDGPDKSTLSSGLETILKRNIKTAIPEDQKLVLRLIDKIKRFLT